jgi:Uncharacterized protein conserved in bacteria|tara:strand:- start:1400 stop:1837 length:438 start_codon:yes stop_codon:yes gene_type:complete
LILKLNLQLNNKLTDKDKKDWNNFTSSKDTLPNKDEAPNRVKSKKTISFIDLHGFSLDDANKTIEKFINNSHKNGIAKITVVTGKGIRSKVEGNPYLSKDLSILKNSVPEFIKLNSNLMKKIKKITEANIEDGGSGAFYIYLKKN